MIAKVRFEADSVEELRDMVAAAQALHGDKIKLNKLGMPSAKHSRPTWRQYCTIEYPTAYTAEIVELRARGK